MFENEPNIRKCESDRDELFDSLLSVLCKEVEVYKELHAIMQEEKAALKRPCLSVLYENNTKQETCVLKAKMLEQVRGQVVKKIGRLIGIAEDEINISLLTSLADEERARAFKKQQQTLGCLMAEIRDANETNKGLIDFSLTYVRNSINFINNIMSTGADYGSSGQLKSDGLYGRLVNREG